MAIINTKREQSLKGTIFWEKTVITKTNKMTISISSKIILFSKAFTHIAPKTLKAKGTRESNANGDNRKTPTPKNFGSLHLKHTKTTPIKIKLLKIVIKGANERGLETPRKGHNSFIKSPANIRNATLDPVEKRTISNTLKSFNFNSFKRIKPGIKVK
jgi:hypothetical protein